MQQCDLPPSGGQVNEGEWGYSGYIWGVSLIKRTSLSPVAYQGWKIGEEGDQCLTVDKRSCTYAVT